jgi:hypothetical protein
VVVVAASGNDGWTNAMGTPACGSNVIAVGGVYDSNWAWVKWGCLNSRCTRYMCKDEPAEYDTRFCASNGGPQLDVVAPGMQITSAGLGGGWVTMSGTSMATPHVAGLVALLLEKDSSLGPDEILTLLKTNAVDKGAANFDYLYGFGRIDAKATWDAVGNSSPYCGDGICNSTETRCDCTADCGVPPSDEVGVCNDGIDNDCDLQIDCDDSDCDADPACSLCSTSESGMCSDGIDNDCDGYTDCFDDDCSSDSACTQCSSFKESCQSNAECCAGLSCHPVKKYCR